MKNINDVVACSIVLKCFMIKWVVLMVVCVSVLVLLKITDTSSFALAPDSYTDRDMSVVPAEEVIDNTIHNPDYDSLYTGHPNVWKGAIAVMPSDVDNSDNVPSLSVQDHFSTRRKVLLLPFALSESGNINNAIILPIACDSCSEIIRNKK